MKIHLPLAIAIVGISILPAQAHENAVHIFPDVNDQDWFAPYVREISEDGVIQGYPDGRYGAWEPVNRAELAKILVNYKHLLNQDQHSSSLFETLILLTCLLGWGGMMIFCQKMVKLQQRLAEKLVAESRSEKILSSSSPINTEGAPRAIQKSGRRYWTHLLRKKHREGAGPHPRIVQRRRIKQLNQQSNWWH